MSTLNQELTFLEETKTLIREAIENKGQIITDEDSFRSYVDRINEITTGGRIEFVTIPIAFDHTEIGTVFQSTYSISYFEVVPKKGDVHVIKNNDTSTHNRDLVITSVQDCIVTDFSGAESTITVSYLLVEVFEPYIDTALEDNIAAENTDIIIGKSAFVNGAKVNGNIPSADNYFLTEKGTNIEINYETLSNQVLMTGLMQDSYTDNKYIAIDKNTEVGAKLDASRVAAALGISADKIKKDENIIGISGVYEGAMSEEDYSEAIEIANDILGNTIDLSYMPTVVAHAKNYFTTKLGISVVNYITYLSAKEVGAIIDQTQLPAGNIKDLALIIYRQNDESFPYIVLAYAIYDEYDNELITREGCLTIRYEDNNGNYITSSSMSSDKPFIEDPVAIEYNTIVQLPNTFVLSESDYQKIQAKNSKQKIFLYKK